MNAENRARTALTTDNYNFILKGYESTSAGAATFCKSAQDQE